MKIVDADTLSPVDPQVGYVDGYGIAERLLEGVLFEITIDDDGQPQCLGVHEDYIDYCEQFSEKKMSEWCQRALEQGADECLMDFAGTTDLIIVDEDGLSGQ